MPNRVDGVETRTVRTAPGGAVNNRSADAPASEAKGGTPAAGVAVQITGAARGLAAIEQGLRNLPAVNESRVAAVRQRLDDGSYRVDPQRIADRLLNLEQDLGRGNPVDDRTLK